MPNIRTSSPQHGQAIVLIALLILVLFGMLGLAIDSGRGYVDRRDQQTAVDAAALAAGDWYENYSDQFDLYNTVIPKAVVVYQNNLRIYSAGSLTYRYSGPYNQPPNPNLLDDKWTYTFAGNYTLNIEAINTQFNGYEFIFQTSHQLPLAFIQIFGGNPSITVGATATSIVGNQRQTPALLTLSTGPCATTMQGNGQLTIVGDAYTNGQACVNGSLKVGGNCYASTGNCNAATYLCINPNTGAVHDPPCVSGDVQGAPYVPAPTLPDPGYLAPEQPYYTAAGSSYNRGSWREMTPGSWNNFSISGGGCYFLDPGVYTWNGGYTSHGGLVSNELKPPTEVSYTAPGSTSPAGLSFWGGCDGAFVATVLPALPGQGIKHQGGGNWGIELTSVRYDRFEDPTMGGNPCYGPPGFAGCMRESAPSICQPVSTVDANNSAINVTITQNAPGAQYYNIYIDPYGCDGNRNNFSFVGTYLAPGWTDTGAPPASSPGLGPWSGILIGGRGGWPCGSPAMTICNIDYNNMTPPITQCAFYNARAQKCRSPWDESAPQCFPNVCAVNGAPQENAAMSLQWDCCNGGDIANENTCQQTPIKPGGDPNAPCTTAKITPGAVQFYFPVGNNCLDQNGNGSTHVFSGEQYNWIIIYQAPSTPGTPPNTYCSSQKLNGNSYTQYIGTIYSPTSSWDILGANTAPLAGQVIAYTAKVTGNGNAGILFNPNYAPAPPAARLIN
ncbi:MAG TPA: pilus assembly protein TadG-related protein [Candidatus Dormibacteraeota bacterium]|nr:pilus assembly protein TadG-related protein [Candidatus Dormibacteraeota bacterium]